jgi:putative membrane protein
MTRGLFLTTAIVAALSLTACKKPPSTTDASSTTTTSSANPGQTPPVNAAQDATAAAVGQTSAATLGSHDTGAFVSNASQSDMYEIQAGQMAEQKAKSADVKAFGKMMVTEHTAMTNQMKPLITAAGQKPATALDQRRQGMLDNLKAAGAADFDKTYIDQQVAAHDEALTLMKGYADSGSDAGLKGGAAKAVPKVQAHLDRAKALQAEVSGGAAAPPKT